MSNSHNIKRLLYLIICVAMMNPLFACSTQHTESQNITDKNQTDIPAVSATYDELEENIDYNSARKFNFDNEEFPEIGVNKNGSIYTIQKGGTYVLSGTLSDGQVIVNADKEDVWLVLNNLHITCKDSSPLYIEDAKSTYLIIRTGTKNSLSDSDSYNTDIEQDPDATLFCKNDLIVGGHGELTISSNYNNAVHTKDTLKIHSGIINIESVDTGIVAKDGIDIFDTTLHVTCRGDGIKTTNNEDTSLANINIDGGDITINSEKDAIQSENALYISDGKLNLITGDGAENADFSYSNDMMPPGRQQEFYLQSNEPDKISIKALKAKNDITVLGGSFTINSEDDALHSNANITVCGGNFHITSGDDGIHADKEAHISAGKIDISMCYEGIEGSKVTISGGNIRICSADDGINSAGGNDTTFGGFGQDRFSHSSDYSVDIKDGYIYIDSTGDGIDSNGSIHIDGGTTIVTGPENSMNASLDRERECIINGGILIACGASGMVQSPDINSEQCALTLSFSTLSANTLINVSDEDGFSFTFSPAKNISSLIISHPELAVGKTYTVSKSGTHTGESIDGIYQNGKYTSSEVLFTVTQDSTITNYGSNGGFGGGGFHGGGGFNNHGTPPDMHW